MRKFESRSVDGVDMDSQTRCGHYHGPNDVLAIRLACCDVYYGCRECHDALAGHDAEVWPASRFDETALFCGRCGKVFPIRTYLDCPDRCPHCAGEFNPNCRSHHQLYFDKTTNA